VRLDFWQARLARLLLSALLAAPTLALAAGQELKLSLKGDLAGTELKAEVDFRREAGHLFRRHYDVGVRIPLSELAKGLSLGLNYRLVYTPADNGGWNLEKRPHMQLQKTFDTAATAWFPALRWGLRSRHEFRFRQQKEDSQRNRIRLKVQSKRAFYTVRPFAANEYYYDFRKDELSKIKAELGLSFNKVYGLKPSLSYKYTSTHKQGEWQSYSALALKLAF